MAGLHELYGVENAQELLSRLRPREKRARRIHVDRQAIKQQLEKEGVGRWNVPSSQQKSVAQTKALPMPETDGVNSDELGTHDMQESCVHPLPVGNNEVIETTPTEFPKPPFTSTPIRYILPELPRRRVVSSQKRKHDDSLSLHVPTEPTTQAQYDCDVSALSQSASAAAVISTCVSNEESGVVEPAQVSTKQTVVGANTIRKHGRHQTQEDENVDVSGGDQEVCLLAIETRKRSARAVTDLDVAMSVVKRVCLDYGCNRENHEQEAIRSFYQHVKETATKAIGDLYHLNEVRRELNKLKKDRAKQMENLLYLQRRKTKLDVQLKQGREQMTDLADKRNQTESCLKFLKDLEQMKLRLSV